MEGVGRGAQLGCCDSVGGARTMCWLACYLPMVLAGWLAGCCLQQGTETRKLPLPQSSSAYQSGDVINTRPDPVRLARLALHCRLP